MMRILRSLLILVAIATPAMAMNQSAIPTKFPIPWGNSASVPYINTIPTASQIGVTNCRASLTDGFPPLTFTPQISGGCPPFGGDFNGILKQITQWTQWWNAGAPVFYDSGFSTSISGYPKGAVLSNASTTGCFWTSTVDGNTSNPDSGGANWIGACQTPTSYYGATSTGSANAQVVSTTTPANFTLVAGNQVTFKAGYANTAALQINVNSTGLTNVYRQSQLGATLSVGGEIFAGQMVTVEYDGTEFQCLSCKPALVGEIKDFAGSTAPNGWLFIDGSCQSQTTYADLYGVVSTNYGSCSAGNFALPDGRGNALVGLDNQGSNGNANRLSGCTGHTTIGSTCGAQNETIAQANLPNLTLTTSIASGQGSHTHTTTYNGSSASTQQLATAFGNSPSSAGNGQAGNHTFSIDSATLPSMTGTTPTGGSGTALTTVQPVQFVSKIIKF